MKIDAYSSQVILPSDIVGERSVNKVIKNSQEDPVQNTRDEFKRGAVKWNCGTCKPHNNRDDNASFNLWQEGWRLLEISFQENNAEMLAAGSAVRGAQGVVCQKEEKKLPQKSKKKSTSECLNAVPTEKTAGDSRIKASFLRDKK